MSRAKNQRRIPSLTLHKPTGRARVRIDGKDHYLGEFGSIEAQRAYDRLISKWLALQAELPANDSPVNCKQSIYYYIELYYNSRRRHAAIGYLCPNDYEARAAQLAA